MNTKHLLFAPALTLGLAAVGMAQEPMTDTDEPPAPVDAQKTTPSATDYDTVETPSTVAPRNIFESGAGAVKLLAGTGDFTQEGARNATGIGPSWDVRAVFGAHTPLGVEAAYVGSTRALTGSSIFGGDQLMSNGAEANVRLAAPIRASENVDVRPFAFGGVGWQYMTVWGDGAHDGAPSTTNEGDNILTIPAGVGIELGLGALNLDLRATYRHAVDSEIFGDAGSGFGDANALHSYNGSAGLGFEF